MTTDSREAADLNVVEQLHRRNPGALAQLFDRYGRALYSRLLRGTGSRSAAEDLTLEIFVRAWNRVSALQPGDSVEPWLLAIAKEAAPECPEESVPAPAPPKLRRRILSAAGRERFGWAPFLGGAAVLALSAAVYFGGRERTFATEVLALREQMRQQDVALTRFNEAMNLLNAEGTTEVSFTSGKVRGKVFVSPKRGVVLVASNLTPAPQGQVYQMWLIDKGGAAAPAGLFTVQPESITVHVDRQPVDASSLSSVALTLEREGGSSRPSSPPFLSVPLR